MYEDSLYDCLQSKDLKNTVSINSLKVFTTGINSFTFEQHPPNIKASIAPIVSHCGIVSMNSLPIRAIILEEVGRSLSMPDIRAALIIFGGGSISLVEECNSRGVARLRAIDCAGIDVGRGLLQSTFCFFAMLAADCFARSVWRLSINWGQRPPNSLLQKPTAPPTNGE
jgi:hypothetical protein